MLKRYFLLLGLLMSPVVFLTGCAPAAYEMNVYLSPDLKAGYGIYPSLEFDAAAISDAENERLAVLKVDEYFAVDGLLRGTLHPKTLNFSNDAFTPLTISSHDSCWKLWSKKDPTTILMVVNLPDAMKDDKGIDSRVLRIPFETSTFFKDVRYVQITASGLLLLKEPPEKIYP